MKLFGQQLEKVRKFSLHHTQTSLPVNSTGIPSLKVLPPETRISMTGRIPYPDYEGDGRENLFPAGNFYPSGVRQDRCDAGIGCLLKRNRMNSFFPVSHLLIGFLRRGHVAPYQLKQIK